MYLGAEATPVEDASRRGLQTTRGTGKRAAARLAVWQTRNMSCAVLPANGVCANCGKAGGDGVKLRNCTACLLVKYCGVDCQRAHRKQHKKACKKRAAELKDERLYGQGHERPEGDFCPICTLPIPLPMEKHSVFNVCCMKRVCDGCEWQRVNEEWETPAHSAGRPLQRMTHPDLPWSRSALMQAMRMRWNSWLAAITTAISDWRKMCREQLNCGQKRRNLDQSCAL